MAADRVLISSAPLNTVYDRLLHDPSTAAVHDWPVLSVSVVATRPWPFGTVLRRTPKNLAEIRGARDEIAEQRVLVIADGGGRTFTGLTIHDSRPERVGRTYDDWIAEYWEPVRA